MVSFWGWRSDAFEHDRHAGALVPLPLQQRHSFDAIMNLARRGVAHSRKVHVAATTPKNRRRGTVVVARW